MRSLKERLKYLPTIGIVIFICIYTYSSFLYPGGSSINPNSEGYDWLNNLWCNLMSVNAINGQENPARPHSIAGIIILGLSMIVFFFQFTRVLVKRRVWKNTIKITGVIAMISAAFIFTDYHDIMTTILSLCGLLGIISIIRTLQLNKMHFLSIWGVCCLIIIGLNNLFYYMEGYSNYLPVVQLLDFILVLGWTIVLNFVMVQKANQNVQI